LVVVVVVVSSSSSSGNLSTLDGTMAISAVEFSKVLNRVAVSAAVLVEPVGAVIITGGVEEN